MDHSQAQASKSIQLSSVPNPNASLCRRGCVFSFVIEGVKLRVMGGERKSKEKKKRSSPSDSEDERKIKRHRTVEDGETKRSKRDKKDKSNKEKNRSRKSSKHHFDREKEEKRHKDKRHKHDHHSKLEFHELSHDDYFSKNNEFATWLKEEKNMFFSDLSSESARDLFSQFVKDWNNQKLESRYYEGIVTGPRTAHKWKIKH